MPSLVPGFGPRTGATLLLGGALLLGACSDPAPPAHTDAGGGATPPAGTDIDEGFIARTTREAIERARDKIATANISVGGGEASGTRIRWLHPDAGDQPRAEIGPQGDFIVDGQAVPVDAEQRALLLAHRANVVAIAEAGMEVGVQGARLGLGAARDALGAVLGGQTEDFEQRLAAEGAQLEVEAMRICDRMPALLASQQALADALPAFVPYAGMTSSDIDDCRRGARDAGSDAAHAPPPPRAS